MPALMQSELPEVARTRHHWIVLLRLPNKWLGLGLVALLVWAVISPAMWLVLIVLLAVMGFLRWQTWRAEQIILTQRRIIRIEGVPETTTLEASLRLDRVSGARVIQTVPGKLLGYGSIMLEAPGEHPDIRRLVKIRDPHGFYRRLRPMVFGDRSRSTDPDDNPQGYVTEPLPRIPPHSPGGA